MSTPRSAATIVSVLFAAACSGMSDASAPTAPVLDVNAIASQHGKLYVLTGTTAQRSERVATTDITCDSLRTVVTVRDSLRLWSNGAAQRSGTVRMTRNGVVTYDARLVNHGTWKPYTSTTYGFYNEAPGIVLTLVPERGTPIEWYLRRSGTAGFSTRQALGAVCSARATAVVSDPPRHEEWFYTPR